MRSPVLSLAAALLLLAATTVSASGQIGHPELPATGAHETSTSTLRPVPHLRRPHRGRALPGELPAPRRPLLRHTTR